MLGGALGEVLSGVLAGALVLAFALATEWTIARYFAPWLVPTGDSALPFGAFSTLAVQVSASLLGFYLASVSIVLGTSYHDVSANVRSLVLGSPQATRQFKLIGAAIGVGLALLLLEQVRALPLGYMTAALYAALVTLGGWAFIRLALGAFHLFDPSELGQEPLRALYQAISQIGASGLLGDEAVLRATAARADRALGMLAELIRLTKDRASTDRDGLADLADHLLLQVQLYAGRKHSLPPTSPWFRPGVAYPKWIEANYWEVSTALQTSTPLPPRVEPDTDWLEVRAAVLASAALEACVVSDDRDAAIRVMRAAASTVDVLAYSYCLDEALTFSAIVRDRCWTLPPEHDATVAVAAEPVLLLASLLAGWRRAIASWPAEVRRTVAETEWERENTTVVQIRGPVRVWTAAQRLLREVKAEHRVEGRRVTPDWYLQSVLAGECVRSLREFAEQLPKILDDYFATTALTRYSPAVKAAAGSQALQALAKAGLVAETTAQVMQELQDFRRGHEVQDGPEVEGLPAHIEARHAPVLEHIAEALSELRPERSQASPDLFGQSFFTLSHATEQAIARADAIVNQRTFSSLLASALTFYEYLVTTYKPPMYQPSSAVLDPVLEVLELSGLAVIYETLRDDSSAGPIRQAWTDWLQGAESPERLAEGVLNALDIADNLILFPSPRHISRGEWSRHLGQVIVDAGYARPDGTLFGPQPEWKAPTLIKMLGFTSLGSTPRLHPRAVFAAQVVAPWTPRARGKPAGPPRTSNLLPAAGLLRKA